MTTAVIGRTSRDYRGKTRAPQFREHDKNCRWSTADVHTHGRMKLAAQPRQTWAGGLLTRFAFVGPRRNPALDPVLDVVSYRRFADQLIEFRAHFLGPYIIELRTNVTTSVGLGSDR